MNLTTALPVNIRVFISYSARDKDVVRSVCNDLTLRGLNLWIDDTGLRGGDAWWERIRDAIHACDAAVICLTADAASRLLQAEAGYFGQEIQLIMARQNCFPAGKVFTIPLRLEPCSIPEYLEPLHCIDYFRPDGLQLLASALKAAEAVSADLALACSRELIELQQIIDDVDQPRVSGTLDRRLFDVLGRLKVMLDGYGHTAEVIRLMRHAPSTVHRGKAGIVDLAQKWSEYINELVIRLPLQ